ncbi:helix-turn-helix transcriptional regulator [Sinorhizobium meliloti]
MHEFLEGPRVAILLKPLSASEKLASYALSAREGEVAKAILVGKSVQQIADECDLSRETIRTQLKSVFAKLGVASQIELVRKFSDH